MLNIFLGLFFLCTCNLNCSIASADLERLNEFAQLAYSTKDTLYHTFKLSVTCLEENIQGDFVECGVAAGAQIAAMGLACMNKHADRMIYLFDSFEGIPLAGPNDDQQPGIGSISHDVHMDKKSLLISSGITVHSLEEVKNNMTKWGIPSCLLSYHKGWFQNTIPLIAKSIKSICLLRLDGDLYESTKVCLEYLYPKVSKDGYVIIDDYALVGCRKAVDEYLEKNNIKVKIQPVPGSDGPVYWRVS